MASSRFELYQLRCFVAVAEELNFRRAAERLHMTQPPLSRQIKLLEHGIGLTLLERSNKSVRLTAAGESFFASATDLLQRAERAVLVARQAERGEIGAVAMGFVPSAAIRYVPIIVEALATSLPKVSFKPVEMMSYEIGEALNSSQLDLGLTRTAPDDPEIFSECVVNEPFVLAVHKDHPLAEIERPALADLNGMDFIGYSAERGGILREVHRGLFASAGVVPRIKHEVSQTHTILALVDSGIGAALVPASAQAMLMRNLVYREIETPKQFCSSLYLICRPTRGSKLLSIVKDIIVAALSQLDAEDDETPSASRPVGAVA